MFVLKFMRLFYKLIFIESNTGQCRFAVYSHKMGIDLCSLTMQLSVLLFLTYPINLIVLKFKEYDETGLLQPP